MSARDRLGDVGSGLFSSLKNFGASLSATVIDELQKQLHTGAVQQIIEEYPLYIVGGKSEKQALLSLRNAAPILGLSPPDALLVSLAPRSPREEKDHGATPPGDRPTDEVTSVIYGDQNAGFLLPTIGRTAELCILCHQWLEANDGRSVFVFSGAYYDPAVTFLAIFMVWARLKAKVSDALELIYMATDNIYVADDSLAGCDGPKKQRSDSNAAVGDQTEPSGPRGYLQALSPWIASVAEKSSLYSDLFPSERTYIRRVLQCFRDASAEVARSISRKTVFRLQKIIVEGLFICGPEGTCLPPNCFVNVSSRTNPEELFQNVDSSIPAGVADVSLPVAVNCDIPFYGELMLRFLYYDANEQNYVPLLRYIVHSSFLPPDLCVRVKQDSVDGFEDLVAWRNALLIEEGGNDQVAEKTDEESQLALNLIFQRDENAPMEPTLPAQQPTVNQGGRNVSGERSQDCDTDAAMLLKMHAMHQRFAGGTSQEYATTGKFDSFADSARSLAESPAPQHTPTFIASSKAALQLANSYSRPRPDLNSTSDLEAPPELQPAPRMSRSDTNYDRPQNETVQAVQIGPAGDSESLPEGDVPQLVSAERRTHCEDNIPQLTTLALNPKIPADDCLSDSVPDLIPLGSFPSRPPDEESAI